MNYHPRHDNILKTIIYGSRLYGTNTPESDYDFKAIYLPDYKDLLLCKTPPVLKYRFNEDGTKITDDSLPMPENGYEAEHIPVQKFVRDFLSGQAYAVELAFAVVQNSKNKDI